MWLPLLGGVGQRGLELSGHVPALLPEDTSHLDADETRDSYLCSPYTTALGQGLSLGSLAQWQLGRATPTSGAWVWAGSGEV